MRWRCTRWTGAGFTVFIPRGGDRFIWRDDRTQGVDLPFGSCKRLSDAKRACHRRRAARIEWEPQRWSASADGVYAEIEWYRRERLYEWSVEAVEQNRPQLQLASSGYANGWTRSLDEAKREAEAATDGLQRMLASVAHIRASMGRNIAD